MLVWWHQLRCEMTNKCFGELIVASHTRLTAVSQRAAGDITQRANNTKGNKNRFHQDVEKYSINILFWSLSRKHSAPTAHTLQTPRKDFYWRQSVGLVGMAVQGSPPAEILMVLQTPLISLLCKRFCFPAIVNLGDITFLAIRAQPSHSI